MQQVDHYYSPVTQDSLMKVPHVASKRLYGPPLYCKKEGFQDSESLGNPGDTKPRCRALNSGNGEHMQLPSKGRVCPGTVTTEGLWEMPEVAA